MEEPRKIYEKFLNKLLQMIMQKLRYFRFSENEDDCIFFKPNF